jgi:uncharacterized Zn-binding protein involved in type VI secretion
MNCPNEEVLLDYIAGRLDGAQASLFARHGDECARCGQLVAAQAAVWRSLDEWKPAPVSAGFNRELWRRIDADEEASSWRRDLGAALRFDFWKRLAPLAVALVVTGYMLDHSGKPIARTGSGSVAAFVVTASDADQLDRALDDLQLLHEADTASSTPAKLGTGVM